MYPSNPPVRQRGFTLLEMLVALAIAAAIAAMAYQSLVAASNGAERSRQIMARINEMDRAWQIIGADLRHLLAPERLNDGRVRFVLRAREPDSGEAEQPLLRFSRRNWLNPLERQRSDLQRVVYRLEDGTLWRDFQPLRNRPFEEFEFEQRALNQELLQSVESVELRFLSARQVEQAGESALEGDNYTRNWAEAWPEPNRAGVDPEAGLPLAILIRIETEALGVSERLFDIARF